MLLDGTAIGYFLVYDDWTMPYGVSGKCYFSFGRAVRAAGRYLTRQVAYYQLLQRRAQPLSEWLRAESMRLGRTQQMDLRIHYYCTEAWALAGNHVYVRWTRERTRYELCIYGDRFTFGRAGQAPQQFLLTEQEVMALLKQEPAG